MSCNLDLVRSIYADWEQGDYRRSDWAHPGIEYVIADGPAPGRWTGVGGMAEGFRDLLAGWSEWRQEPDEYLELDDEWILVLDHIGGRGRRSGLEVGQFRTRAAKLFYVRHGQVTRFVVYWDRDRALADLGVAPEGESQ